MKHSDQKSAVMKAANSAVARTGSWSSAKLDFAHRVTTSTSMAQKTRATNTKSLASSVLSEAKK